MEENNYMGWPDIIGENSKYWQNQTDIVIEHFDPVVSLPSSLSQHYIDPGDLNM